MGDTYTLEQIILAMDLCPKYKMISPVHPERDDCHSTEMNVIEIDMFLHRLKNKTVQKLNSKQESLYEKIEILEKAEKAFKAIKDNFPLTVLKDQMGEDYDLIEKFIKNTKK